MKNLLYPTEAQISVVVKWCNEGAQALDPASVIAGVRIPSPQRARSLQTLGELLRRLDLHDELDWLRRKAFKKDLSLHLDEAILSAALRSLRYHGYVYRVGPVPEGRTRPNHYRTPMTGRELHILRLLAQGHTGVDVGDALGMGPNSIRQRLYDIRMRFGAVTTAHLVATAYENEWIPTRIERDRLDRLSGGPVTWPGYISLELEETEA